MGTAAVRAIAPSSSLPPVAGDCHFACREGQSVLLAPFRTRPAHVVELGSIRIEDSVFRPAPHRDQRRQTGCREDRVSSHSRRAENRNHGAAHDDQLFWSGRIATSFGFPASTATIIAGL